MKVFYLCLILLGQSKTGCFFNDIKDLSVCRL